MVVITSRFPFPLEKGDKLRAYYQLKELSTRFEIHLISLTEHNVSKVHQNELSTICKSMYVFHIGFLERWLLTFFQLFGNKPFQIGYFTSYRVKRKVTNLLQNLKPDHIYCQLIRPAEYVKNYHDCDKTIDYMDALSKGVERRYESASWYKKPFFKAEFLRLKNYEHKIFDYFEHHTIISEQDKNVIFHTERNKIKVIPNGVDQNFFSYSNSADKKFDLVFTGNMNYPPNIEASKFIVNDILPHFPDLQLVLAGANPSEEIKKLRCENVTITGWVEDIKAVYLSGKIFIAPMFIGTGLQNKLLEAMALGIPCVTTSLANNALHAVPNESILIANTKEEFTEAINRLMKDEKMSARIAQNGKAFVLNNYNWQTATKLLIDLIEG
ncbi:MAG: glycosyltransferase [Lishizhenia sp.]